MEPSSRESITRQISRIPVDIARDGLPREERSVIEVNVRHVAGKVASVASLTFSRNTIARPFRGTEKANRRYGCSDGELV